MMGFPLAGTPQDPGYDCSARHMREIADKACSSRIPNFVDYNLRRMSEDFERASLRGQHSVLAAVDGKDDELMALFCRLGELGYAAYVIGKGEKGWTISVDWSNA